MTSTWIGKLELSGLFRKYWDTGTRPPPRPVLVVRYADLWRREVLAGAAEGHKERPCAIVLAVRKDAEGDPMVVVARITTQPLHLADTALPVPPAVRRTPGLDEAPSWVMTDEVNLFAWPGFDHCAIPGRPGEYAHDMLPARPFEDLRQRIQATIRTRRSTVRR